MRKARGFVALALILIVVVVFATVTTTVVLLSVGEVQSSLALSKGEQNLQLVEGCAEDVLQDVHDYYLFSAATITRPEGTCQITYNLSGPINWDVTVTTAATDYQRTVRVVFTRNATATITSWLEI